MKGFFTALYDLFHRQRIAGMVLLVIAIATMAFIASRVRFKEDISDMLPGSAMSEVFKNSSLSDRIILTITAADTSLDPEDLIQTAEAMSESLNGELKSFVNSVEYRVEEERIHEVMETMRRYLPLFMEESDYRRLDSVLTDEGLARQVQSNYVNLIGPAGFALKRTILEDPLGMSAGIYKKLERLGADEQFTLYDQCYFSEDGKTLLMFINPANPSSETKKNSEFFNRLDQLIAKQVAGKSVDIHYFGAPAVAAGNAGRIRTDTILTLSLTIILLLVITLLFFRNLLSPLLIMVPVVFGALFALTAVYLFKGSISIIALGAGSLILGIAVNYSLHFMTHLRFDPDRRTAIRELAFPMTAGSLTTIGGFLCLQLVQSPVLRDLGFYAAFSLMGAALATLIILPHLTLPKKADSRTNNPQPDRIHRFIARLSATPYLFTIILILTPVFLWFARDIRFETDMYKINYMPEKLKESELFINQFTSRFQKSVFMVTEARTVNEALASSAELLPAQEQLLQEGAILSYTNIATFIPPVEIQQQRIGRWNQYWQENDPLIIHQKLSDAGKAYKFKASAFDGFHTLTSQPFTLLPDSVSKSMIHTLFRHLAEIKDDKVVFTGLIRTRPEQMKTVYAALSGFEHTIAFDRQYLTDQLVQMVGDDFNFITIWTSLLVFIALLIIYGRIELALISFLPMVFSWIWILGIMALFGITFNIINIVLSTLIFALGDDYCIFTTDSMQEGYARKTDQLKSTSTSITLSALTTITGMGVLIFAQHPALKSIALVSIIGVAGVWLFSQILQPRLYNFLITSPTSQKHEPYTFKGILISLFAFSYFIFGSLLISLIGLIMFRVIPGNSLRKKFLYHTLLKMFTWSMVYIMGNVKKTIINPNREDFSKPAVIIANHSSVLDILFTVMLHPKLILLTNKWVWNSPLFGSAVRFAQYYPVMEGAENTIPQLSKIVNEGYSIVVFPEGTRSVDGTINRFHKGAFYIAEQLKIDVLPLLIHGASHTLSKGYFYLKDSSVSLKFLPRIPHNDPTFGMELRDRTKLITAHFRREFALFRNEMETPHYFRNPLFHNYLYKGPVLEWYMKVKVRLENDYELFNQIVPKYGKIVDLGCGYGFLSYILALTSSLRTVTGVDYDQEKIEIAGNGYLKGKNLEFVASDILEYDLSKTDVIMLNDVLHYLQNKEQLIILERCAQALNPGGRLIIRDGVRELKERHRGTKLTEFFSTRLLGFNKTKSHGLEFISKTMIEDLARRFHLTLEIIDNTRMTSNLIFILTKPNN